MRFASLMNDGTFSLAMVEGYSCKAYAPSLLSCSLTPHRAPWLSDCPGCGGWPAGDCCSHAQATTPIGGDPVNWIAGYLPRLDFARKMGYLNRTIFCLGTHMNARSPINPHGWTTPALRIIMKLGADSPPSRELLRR